MGKDQGQRYQLDTTATVMDKLTKMYENTMFVLDKLSYGAKYPKIAKKLEGLKLPIPTVRDVGPQIIEWFNEKTDNGFVHEFSTMWDVEADEQQLRVIRKSIVGTLEKFYRMVENSNIFDDEAFGAALDKLDSKLAGDNPCMCPLAGDNVDFKPKSWIRTRIDIVDGFIAEGKSMHQNKQLPMKPTSEVDYIFRCKLKDDGSVPKSADGNAYVPSKHIVIFSLYGLIRELFWKYNFEELAINRFAASLDCFLAKDESKDGHATVLWLDVYKTLLCYLAPLKPGCSTPYVGYSQIITVRIYQRCQSINGWKPERVLEQNLYPTEAKYFEVAQEFYMSLFAYYRDLCIFTNGKRKHA